VSRGVVLLALDTAGPRPGAAVVDAGGRVRSSYLDESSGKRSEAVGALAVELLAQAGLALSALQAIAVVTGPGSYTGLRTGLALVRGLAFLDSLPVVGVGSLELFAFRAGSAGKSVLAVASAGSERFYCAAYAHAGDTVEARDDVGVLEADELRRRIDEHRGADCLIAADAASTPSIVALRPVPTVVRVDDGAVTDLARLGVARHARGQARPAAQVLPCYVGTSTPRPNQARVAAAFLRPHGGAHQPE